MFDSECEEVKGELRKLHNEELHELYTPLNVTRVKIGVIESRRMRWAGHVYEN
jgi:hypothetical protein